MNKKTKNILLIGIGLFSVIGIVYYFYKKNKKVTANDILDVADNNISINVKNTKAYAYIQRELNNVEDLLSNYQKTNTTLLDIKLNQNISVLAEQSLYIMITKNWETIKQGILKDISSTSEQRQVLLKMYNDYFDSYLTRWFNKDKYNINQKWYKDRVSKMSLINLYK